MGYPLQVVKRTNTLTNSLTHGVVGRTRTWRVESQWVSHPSTNFPQHYTLLVACVSGGWAPEHGGGGGRGKGDERETEYGNKKNRGDPADNSTAVQIVGVRISKNKWTSDGRGRA